MFKIFLVAIGGMGGAVARYLLGGWIANQFGNGALGTFTVNIVGSFVLGILMGLTEGRFYIDPMYRTLIGIGFLGAFTTFSTLAYETVALAELNSFLYAGANIVGSVIAGLIAVYAGLTLARLI